MSVHVCGMLSLCVNCVCEGRVLGVATCTQDKVMLMIKFLSPGLQVPSITTELMSANATLHSYDVRNFISSVSMVIFNSQEYYTPAIAQSIYAILVVLGLHIST